MKKTIVTYAARGAAPGERAMHPMGAAERLGMAQAKARAEAAQRRLEAKRARVWYLAADTALLGAGATAMLSAQYLWAGDVLSSLLMGGLTLLAWAVAAVARDTGGMRHGVDRADT